MPSTRPDSHVRDVETLLEALPYIREFHGRTVVIKYGGAAMEDPALREEFARDVVLLKYVGLNPVVVHGGGPEITSYMERLQMPVEFVGGLRVSDEATVEVARAMRAYKVMFLTDVPGWMRDAEDLTSVVSEATAAEVVEALDGVAGGMRPKLQACVDALHGGVTFAHIVDGRVPHSLLLELFTDAGVGTKIRQ